MGDELDQRFGRALKALREAAGKTQEEVRAVPRTYLSELERGLKTPTLDTIVRLAGELGVTPAQIVARATSDSPERSRRTGLEFLVADPAKVSSASLDYAKDGRAAWRLEPQEVQAAAVEANRVLALAHDALALHHIPFFELLGTRNLGSFVGAVFVYSLRNLLPDRLMVNRHQDGYPDLCARTAKGKEYVAGLPEWEADAKKHWASYPHGGVEVKTTCGNVPAATKTRRKPGIGDPRWAALTGADWKAHHRDTNNLLGLFWDFVDRIPTVLAAFYRNDLSNADWGKLTVPKSEAGDEAETVEEGMGDELKVERSILVGNVAPPARGKKPGRTTSVSVMTGDAVRKMGKSWLLLPADPELARAVCQKRVFDLRPPDLESRASAVPPAVLAALGSGDQPTDARKPRTGTRRGPRPA